MAEVIWVDKERQIGVELQEKVVREVLEMEGRRKWSWLGRLGNKEEDVKR